MALFILFAVLAAITIFGHAIWLFCAAAVKAISADSSGQSRRGGGPLVECLRCGQWFHELRPQCPNCGLDPQCAEAIQVRNLEIAAEQIARLVRHEMLTTASAAPVEDSLEKVKGQLLDHLGAKRKRRAVDEVIVADVVMPAEMPQPPDIAAILAACPDVRQLSAAERQRALAWYRAQAGPSWEGQPPVLLLNMARLLRMAGLGSRALHLYELLMPVSQEMFPQVAEAAVEGAVLADKLDNGEQTHAFVQRALTLALTPDQLHEIDALRSDEDLPLATLEVEEIPVVQPAPQGVKAQRKARVVAKKPVPAAPAPPRRSWGEMLAGFMEERNILWGELVGGLLIVGCSIALVISLRKTLEDVPYFPFFIIGAVTAALIGAGRYTLSHWKLESTSRGLLVIGTMLVPLSFMVLGGLSSGRTGDLWELGIETAALALFSWFVHGAAGILIRPALGTAARAPDWLATAAIMGCSAGQLLVPHIEAIADPLSGTLGLVGYVPAGFFLLTQGLVLAQVNRRDQLSARQAGGLFLSLGLSLYAVVVALGFVLYRVEDVSRALEYLAVPVALSGVPLVVGGTLASARLSSAPAAAEAGSMPRGVAGVIATITSLGGTLFLLLALGAAWPQPVRLTAIGLTNAMVLAWVAHRFRLTAAYVPAQLCLAVGIVTGYHLLAGHLEVERQALGWHLWTLWWSPASGVVALGLAAALAGAAEWLKRRGQSADARCLGIGSGVFALLSLVLVATDVASPGRVALVFGACGAGVLAANLRWRQVWLTSLAAVVLLGAVAFAQRWYEPALGVRQALVWVPVLYGALALALVSIAERLPAELRAVFVGPLEVAALLATLLAAPALILGMAWSWLTSAGLAACALATLWLWLAWRWRQPALFAAFQGALALAVLYGVGLWLQGQLWFQPDVPGLARDVRTWQALGLGLSLLALAWAVARFAVRRSDRLWALLEPGLPALDRCLTVGLIGLQLVVAAIAVVPGLTGELTASATGQVPAPVALHLHDPLAWAWLIVLAVTLLLTLWQGWSPVAAPGLAILAVGAVLVVASASWPELAVASALRWGLGITFVLASALVWSRRQLSATASGLGIEWTEALPIAGVVRAILVTGMVVPVLALTARGAALAFAGLSPAGPLEGSFKDLGFVIGNLVPLALVGIGLTGSAVRERSAGYAFAAGLMTLATAAGGYALGVVSNGRTFGGAETALFGQLATIVTATWLLAWRAASRALGHAPAPTAHRFLQAMQLGLNGTTLLIWLAPATMVLMFPLAAPDWAAALKVAAGSWVGWLAVALTIAAGAAYVRDEGRAIPSALCGWAGVLVSCVLACSISTIAPAWDHRALMLALAVLSGGLALALVHLTPLKCPGWIATSQHGIAELLWVVGAGALAVVLAVQRAVDFTDQLWAALAVALVTMTAVTVALRKRHEAWLFVGGLLALLVASMVVWHARPDELLKDWAILLAQVGLTTAAAWGLAWQFNLHWFAKKLGADRTDHPWLKLQQAVIWIGNGLPAAVGIGAVIGAPWEPPAAMTAPLGSWNGWLALAAGAAAVLCFAQRFERRLAIHAGASFALMAGVLAACTANAWGPGQDWTAHHVLTASWVLVAVGILAAAWQADDLRKSALARTGRAAPSWTALVPAAPALPWMAAISAVVVALALATGRADPMRPNWPCSLVLAVSALAGAIAVWTRRGAAVYVSGLLINLAGLLYWLTWLETESSPAVIMLRLGWIQAICLGAASLVWTVIQIGCQRLGRPLVLRGDPLPFRHLACWAALALTVSLALLALAPGSVDDALAWLAVVLTALAAAATLWDQPEERWALPWPQLYVLGVVALMLGLQAADLELWEMWRWAALEYGLYVLLTALWCIYCLKQPDLGAELGMPLRPRGWPLGWFVPAQLVVGAGVALLSTWIVLTYESVDDRLIGAAAAGALLVAAVASTPHWPRLMRGWRIDSDPTAVATPLPHAPYLLTLFLGTFVVILLHCTLVGWQDPAPWLHRTVLVMAAVIWTSVGYGVGLPRLLGRENPWSLMGRRLATPLGAIACVCLALALVQEFFLYDRELKSTPLAAPAVILVAAALAVLIGGALTFALSPGRDVLKLSERGRTLYVYAAEVLIALLFVHLRLNVPQINLGRFGQLWPLVVMAIAFAGVGLSELFQRRGIAVLANPLQRTAMLLPLLPILAFLMQPLVHIRVAADEAVAGAQPFTRFIQGLPSDHDLHAAIWFLMGALYLIVALCRRSSNLALVAVLLANFGSWVYLGHTEGMSLLVHPQLWLIPIGLIVLVAEHVNRERLQAPQSLALRYAGLLLIYLSSTADMFIAGLGHSALLPIVLAVLAVAGVLLGILLRVRAFLFLGITFLFLVVFSQIWHAAVDRAQTWVWWASGIVLGVAILTLFALFEKRRNDVVRVIDDIKRWR
jgi:hypothetical protein